MFYQAGFPVIVPPFRNKLATLSATRKYSKREDRKRQTGKQMNGRTNGPTSIQTDRKTDLQTTINFSNAVFKIGRLQDKKVFSAGRTESKSLRWPCNLSTNNYFNTP